MIFRKKRRMIDIRKLQQRGVVKIPKSDYDMKTNDDGFVELGQKSVDHNNATNDSNAEFFGFMNSTTPSKPQNFSNECDGYNKREVDAKVTELDNKIYRLENRIELLEKKFGINQSSNTNVGVMGW